MAERAINETTNSFPPGKAAPKLLRWYGDNARDLPWRIRPDARKAGAAPDPYRIWLSEIMLQQTTVATVAPRYEEFLIRWPTVEAMAEAPLDDILGQWAGLGYYARARNLHKCARAVAEDHQGDFPQDEQALLKLPGIGAYTAAAIAAIAFDKRAIVIDGNIERVGARLFAIETPLPLAKPEIRAAIASIWPKRRSGDFAQSLMDLGAMICTPRNPKCGRCPLTAMCGARALDIADRLPMRLAKKPKPQRRGAAFALRNAKGEILFERRPDKGLLGGMAGLPGTAWTIDAPGAGDDVFALAPARASWRRLGAITHTFTHFHLTLDVYAAQTRRKPKKNELWIAPEDAALPTIMKKAVELALTAP